MQMPTDLKKGFSLITIIIAIGLSFGLFILVRSYFTSSQSGKYDTTKKTAFFHGQQVTVPKQITDSPFSQVLGSTKHRGEKRIEIDLAAQKLYAYEGSSKIYSFDVSTGKWGRTPTGEYNIYTKLKYTLMTGGDQSIGTYYYLPNVPFTMYFYQGYGIHGAYWHNNFGHPMSHGCINMRPAEAEVLFYWADPVVPENHNSILASNTNPGTKVVIYGTAPND
jgi:lipoprotein-anchoring transpeptidase ErfK/SrfK